LKQEGEMNLETLQTDLGITYTAIFVPFSVSRNAKEKHRTLNWRIILAKGGAALMTDYSQGVGHIPDNTGIKDAYTRRNNEFEASQNGVYCPREGSFTQKRLPPPAFNDVMYSLLMDSEAANQCFEGWASDLGMDVDSREAERTYNTCVKIGLELRKVLAGHDVAAIRELFVDY
jgi:hypothetical protein